MHALPNPWFQFESAWEGLIYNTCIYKNEESHTAKLLDHTNLMWIASVAHALTPIIVLITQLIIQILSVCQTCQFVSSYQNYYSNDV